MANGYCVLLNVKGLRTIPLEKVQAVLDVAKDWARLSPSIWIIASNMSADYWYEKVRATIHPEDDILIVPADLANTKGWAVNAIVEFFARDHDNRPGL